LPTDPRLLRILLIVSLSTGCIDAICLVHLKVFTAYMTGTLILIGTHLGQATPVALPSIIALAAFGIGAVLGGRLIRLGNRTDTGHLSMLARILTLVTLLVIGATALATFYDVTQDMPHYIIIGVLGIAMGIQIAGTRHAGVLDMTIPAATMVLHGLFFDCKFAGGAANRQARRLAIIVALTVGAVIGAALARWHVWIGLLAGAVFLASATAASYALARRSASTAN
jgi:uncharacterized membrane protein YoaK (UPF0700 family)